MMSPGRVYLEPDVLFQLELGSAKDQPLSCIQSPMSRTRVAY
jgi:hypothetical protein